MRKDIRDFFMLMKKSYQCWKHNGDILKGCEFDVFLSGSQRWDTYRSMKSRIKLSGFRLKLFNLYEEVIKYFLLRK